MSETEARRLYNTATENVMAESYTLRRVNKLEQPNATGTLYEFVFKVPTGTCRVYVAPNRDVKQILGANESEVRPYIESFAFAEEYAAADIT